MTERFHLSGLLRIIGPDRERPMCCLATEKIVRFISFKSGINFFVKNLYAQVFQKQTSLLVSTKHIKKANVNPESAVSVF